MLISEFNTILILWHSRGSVHTVESINELSALHVAVSHACPVDNLLLSNSYRPSPFLATSSFAKMSFPTFKDLDKTSTGLYLKFDENIPNPRLALIESPLKAAINHLTYHQSYSCFHAEYFSDDFDSKYTLKVKSAGPSASVSVIPIPRNILLFSDS